MEKTILYSKKSSSIVHNLDIYESCQHEHCKQLLAHIKFLSNSLTQKVLQEQHSSHENILKPKQQNIPQNVIVQSQFTKAIEQQIEQIKKNYLKLRKQLNQVETENDELFEQNQQLKKKIEKLTDQVNKSTFQLSVTRSPVDTKNSFYQPSTTHRNSCDIDPKQIENVILYPRSVDLGIQNIILPADFTKDHDHSHNSHNTQRSEIFERYEKLIKQNSTLQHKINEKQESMKHIQERVKKLEYENIQLKKIIKLRNQIQVERHKTINGLRNVIDEMMA